MGLKVQTPMILFADNKEVVGIVNGWSTGGRTRHTCVKHMFLRELKEPGIVRVIHKPGVDMNSYVFTKNVARSPFEKHIVLYVGKDEYMLDATS